LPLFISLNIYRGWDILIKLTKLIFFIFLDNVQFKKNDWQNRNKIKTSNGEQWLTVPVIHDFGQKITEVKINNQANWKHNHLSSLQHSYAKAPFLEEYKDFFEKAYQQDWDSLVDLNIYFVEGLMQLLGIDTKIVKASDYDVTEDSTQRLIDLCKKVDVDTYIAGKDARKYMDFDAFKDQGIDVVIQEFEHPIYPQLWTEKDETNFLSSMSVVDLLFNCGNESLKIIRQQGGDA